MSSLNPVDVAGLASIVVGFIFLFFFVLAFAIFILGVSNRSDADPRGSRPMAAYLYSAAFLFLWIAFGGVVLALDSLVNLIGSHPQTVFGPAVSYRNEAIRDGVIGAIFLVIAGGAFLVHLGRGNTLADAEADLSGPTKRVMRSFVAFISFVSVLLFVIALMIAFYGACELISPTIFGGAGRNITTTRGILDALVVVVLTGAIFTFHQRFAPRTLRLLGTGAPGPRHASSAPPPPAPPPPQPVQPA